MEEAAFPRGGEKRSSHDNTSIKKKRKKNDKLFQIYDKFKRSKKKTSEKNRPSENPTSDDIMDDEENHLLEPLTLEMLMPGMLIMGCVSEIHGFFLKISLPNSLYGIASITDISTPYKNILRHYAENGLKDDSLQAPSSLNHMFFVGMYVVCKITATQNDKTFDSCVTLTLNPSELYEHVDALKLVNGMLLSCAVESIEEHGYILQTGINGFTGFLKRKDAPRINGKAGLGSQLVVGQLVLCVIQGSNTKALKNSRVLKLISKPQHISKAEVKDEEGTIMTLVPGTQISVDVKAVLESGLIVTFGNCKGVVYRSHLKNHFSTLDEIQEYDTVKGRVLCIHPLTKLMYISLQEWLVNLFPNFGNIRVGDIIDNAKVTNVIDDNVYFQLLPGVKGIATCPNLPVEKDTNIESSYKIGSTHRCVIQSFILMDYLISVSLKKDDINAITYRVEDLAPGDIVKCTVTAINDNGISVKMPGNIRGFIPLSHAVKSVVKNLKKYYRVDQQLTCRILSADVEKHFVLLTNKRSLVNFDLPITSSYEQVRPNMIIEGLVKRVAHNYIIVFFFNSLQGILRSSEIVKDKTTSLGDLFKLGQTVKCMVLSCESDKIELTMKIPNEENITPPPSNEFSVGKLSNQKMLDNI